MSCQLRLEVFKEPRHLPATRADCPDAADGPCPYVSCRHHLIFEINRTGLVTINKQYADGRHRQRLKDLTDNEVLWLLESMDETCALNVAESGPKTSRQIGEYLSCSHQAIDFIEQDAIRKLKGKPFLFKGLREVG